MTAVLRWANGDRQLIELDLHNEDKKVPHPTILFEVGEEECGGHKSGSIVEFWLDREVWIHRSLLTYIEVKK